ncbi:MAG: 3-dehydroquinate synthase [Anaerolineae bacterium]|nr:3-dehydroquinate synthase [Anaerolineae bacterium]NUQ02266.1 3-dehydroquinate synthase [Anaerolineae bacterium]
MAERLRVIAPDSQYDIVIEAGLFAGAKLVDQFRSDGRVAIITNVTLQRLYGDLLRRTLPEALIVTVPDGETHKTLATVAQIYAEMVDGGLDRQSTVVAFGGGVVGDMAGFAAATYMRGVNLVQVPTSLLSMVDSSVGGKVGVDLPQGKNLVGSFKQPEVVLIDPALLATLPARERACGMAEIIKHGLIADPILLDLIARPGSLEYDAELIRRAVQVKIDVVQQDPYEQGIRAYLNLGHTFGHAIEQASDYAFAHGEAVGIGLVAAAMLSARLGMIDAGLVKEVRRLVVQVGLPTRMGSLDPEIVYDFMKSDKKKKAGKLRFILLSGIAQPQIAADVDVQDILAVLAELRGHG